MSTPRSAALEQIFQRVEKESEQRALEAERKEASSRHIRTRSPPPLHAMSSVPILNSSTSQKKERRRGSIIISRVGQLEEPIDPDPVLTFRSASKMSSLALNSPVYGQPQSHSVDSFGSDTQTSPIEDHVTQMQHIARKQSISRTVGGMLTRTLSRSRSKSNLKTVDSQNMVIGVSVEEATVEQEHCDDDHHEEKRRSTVQASSKKQPFKKNHGRGDDGSGSGSSSGWVNKAKGIFRRKVDS